MNLRLLLSDLTHFRRPVLRLAVGVVTSLALVATSPLGLAATKGGAAKTAAKARVPSRSVVKPGRKAPPTKGTVLPPVDGVVGVQPEVEEGGLVGVHGAASFYAYGFQGRRSASGERFDVKALTAATNHYPLGTELAVRRLDTGTCVVVRVNDRMHAKHSRRIVDLSRAAAEQLRMISAGVVLVRIAPIRGKGANACHGAFDPVPAEDCPTCRTPPLDHPGPGLRPPGGEQEGMSGMSGG